MVNTTALNNLLQGMAQKAAPPMSSALYARKMKYDQNV